MSFITSPGVIIPPLTAGGVAYGTGSQAKVNSAGSVGQFLQSAGAGPPVWAAAGGFSQAQVFTASGSFTVPLSGRFKVTIIGGGGSGGGSTVATPHASGGSAGNVIKWFTGATPLATATVTIGAAGTAVTNAAGITGGDSTFVLTGFTTLTASGGGGSPASNSTAGVGGAAVGGDINITGQRGGNSLSEPASTLGGSSLLGFGGVKFGSGPGISGTGFGSGGTGGGSSNASGAGTAGICVVEF